MTPDVQHRFRVGFSPCIAVIAVLTIGLEPAAKPRTHRLPGYSNIDQFCVEGNDIQLWEFASGEAREFRCTSAASHNEFVGIEGELVMLWASDFHPRTLCRPIGPMAEGLYACIAIEETPVWGRPCLVSRCVNRLDRRPIAQVPLHYHSLSISMGTTQSATLIR